MPPKAGRYPNAGKIVPIRPAKTGPINNISVISGMMRKAVVRKL